MGKMRKSRIVAYGAFALATLALVVNTPGIIEGKKQERAVDAMFESYSHALVSGDYVSAYNFCGEAFKRSTSVDAFVEKQRELESTMGRLNKVQNEGTYVHGKGSPMEWTAIVKNRQLHQKGDLNSVCELHLENKVWKLFGCKQI